MKTGCQQGPVKCTIGAQDFIPSARLALVTAYESNKQKDATMNIPVLMLGSYMILMGILGYINSGSPTAFIMSGMGLIAVLLSYFCSKSSIIWWTMTAWVAINTAMIGSMAYKRIITDPQPLTTQLLFGSTAVFAIVVLILLILNRPTSETS